MMIYKTDYHMHSTFSDDKAAPEEYIFPALAAGIKEIGFYRNGNFPEKTKKNLFPFMPEADPDETSLVKTQ